MSCIAVITANTTPRAPVSFGDFAVNNCNLATRAKCSNERHSNELRYKRMTVFMDQYGGLSYVYLQKTLEGDETVSAKAAFERCTKSHGAHVLHYYADNRKFADNKWRKACADNDQEHTFCGVMHISKNGITEQSHPRATRTSKDDVNTCQQMMGDNSQCLPCFEHMQCE